MRDSYDQTEQGVAEWQAAGDTGAYDWGDHLDVIRAAVARGVRIRRVRVVSEPLSDYLRWEHACTAVNIEAGEDIRWLPRTKAADLMLPILSETVRELSRYEGAKQLGGLNLVLGYLTESGIKLDAAVVSGRG
jgi:hypothetical protein